MMFYLVDHTYHTFTSFNNQECLPNCEETRYTASVSQAPFRRCDFKTLGINPLCDLTMTNDNETSFGMIYPQMWGQSVIEQYRYEGNGDLPSYISEKVKDNRRKLVTTSRVRSGLAKLNFMHWFSNHPCSRRIQHCSP